jgi:hypothetical protein
MKRLIYIIPILLFALTSCGIYSFSGTSIMPDVKSISVVRIENRALRVNPSLSNLITEELKEKYRKLTKLSIVDMDADLIVEGEITNYEVTAMAVTANEVASMNRLTITIKIKYTNKKHPNEDFERSFAEFEDYPSSTSLDAAEARLVDAIVEKFTESIFNATVANW